MSEFIIAPPKIRNAKLAQDPEWVSTALRKELEENRKQRVKKQELQSNIGNTLSSRAAGLLGSGSDEELENAIKAVRDSDRYVPSRALTQGSRSKFNTRARPRSSSISNASDDVCQYVASRPWPNVFMYPDLVGGPLIEPHIDTSINQFGAWIETVLVGGENYIETGLGGWIYSGNISGRASISAEIAFGGECKELSAFIYTRSLVDLYIMSWDETGAGYKGNTVIHDVTNVFGYNDMSWSGDIRYPYIFMDVRPNTYYPVYAWAFQYTVAAGGYEVTNQNMFFYLHFFEMCDQNNDD
jgi:hypothetical protein